MTDKTRAALIGGVTLGLLCAIPPVSFGNLFCCAWVIGGGRAAERYRGSRSTHIFCYPTCHAARRIRPELAATFATPAQAEAAGYRSCKLCRPA